MNTELKPKQWFLDRVGKTVIRDVSLSDTALSAQQGYTEVEIKDKFHAEYMFDMQNDLYFDDGIILNYRDEK